MRAILEDGGFALVAESPVEIAAIEAAGWLEGGQFMPLVRVDKAGTAEFSHLQASAALPMLPAGASIAERAAIVAGRGEPPHRPERPEDHPRLKEEIGRGRPLRADLRIGGR
jgi:hypothetical protein